MTIEILQCRRMNSIEHLQMNQIILQNNYKSSNLPPQHDNQVTFLSNWMWQYDDLIFVDRPLYFHVTDQVPKK